MLFLLRIERDYVLEAKLVVSLEFILVEISLQGQLGEQLQTQCLVLLMQFRLLPHFLLQVEEVLPLLFACRTGVPSNLIFFLEERCFDVAGVFG